MAAAAAVDDSGHNLHRVVQFPARLVRQADGSGQSVVINVEGVEWTGGAGGQGGQGGGAAQQGAAGNGMAAGLTALPSLRTLMKSFEGVLPFVLIVFAKVMYDHRLGILLFAAMFGTLFHANSSLRRLIALRETQHTNESLTNLIWLIVFLSANIFFIYYVFDEQKLYRSLYFICPEIEHVTLWVMLWITGVTDFVVKFATVALKAAIALLPRQIMALKKKGKWYMMVEILSQSYRSVLPTVPWIYFLFEDHHNGRWFSYVLLVLYAIFKAGHLLGVYRQLRAAISKFRVDLTYGSAPNRTQLESYDNACPICQDKFTDPVALECSHIFCEDCVATWFNRERTCPMCRANIVDSPQWRDGTTSTSLQLY